VYANVSAYLFHNPFVKAIKRAIDRGVAMDENEATIPQLVDDVREGKMTRRSLITILAGMGISTVGVGAIVAAASQHHTTTPASHAVLKEREHEHIQLHNTHLANQQAGNTSALHHDYAEHAVVEDGMYPAPLVGRTAIMARKGTGLAAVSDFQLAITNRMVRGNQVSAEWVATGTHSGDLPGMPATGRHFTLRGITVTVREHGKIVRESIYYDLDHLRSQIGPGSM
jgi:steroid delta-isomerase-like uncharacterized protein